MEHVSEDELVLLYYGEPGGDGARTHVGECAACRAEYQTLAAVVEHDGRRGRAGAGRGLWTESLGNGLVPGQGQALFVACSGRVGGWFSGWNRVAVWKCDGSTRVLDVALESHFESSRLVLTEIVNQQGPAEMWSRETAEDLLADNRLYRQTAEATGQADTERLLEDLEEVLVEVAHGRAGSEELRRRIETKGVLFAIQVRTAREGIL